MAENQDAESEDANEAEATPTNVVAGARREPTSRDEEAEQPNRAVDEVGQEAGGVISAATPWTLTSLKEWATVLIAVAIVAVSLGLMVQTFRSVDDQVLFNSEGELLNKEAIDAIENAAEDDFERRKDIMNISIGLLGVITGYFFGRVPGEQRASAAERVSANATDIAKVDRADAETARNKLEGERERTQALVPAARAALAALDLSVAAEPASNEPVSPNLTADARSELSRVLSSLED